MTGGLAEIVDRGMHNHEDPVSSIVHLAAVGTTFYCRPGLVNTQLTVGAANAFSQPKHKLSISRHQSLQTAVWLIR